MDNLKGGTATMYDVSKGYEAAKEFYAQYGIDVDKAIEICDRVPLSIHCWQGDDVIGFEKSAGSLTGGIHGAEAVPRREEGKPPRQLPGGGYLCGPQRHRAQAL